MSPSRAAAAIRAAKAAKPRFSSNTFEGRTYPPGAPYQVGREHIRDFAPDFSSFNQTIINLPEGIGYLSVPLNREPPQNPSHTDRWLASLFAPVARRPDLMALYGASAAGMAMGGLRPVFAVYSTFLTRSGILGEESGLTPGSGEGAEGHGGRDVADHAPVEDEEVDGEDVQPALDQGRHAEAPGRAASQRQPGRHARLALDVRSPRRHPRANPRAARRSTGSSTSGSGAGSSPGATRSGART